MTRKLAVLIVDDELLVRQTLHMILQPYKEEIVVVGEACNGQEAIEQIERWHPDVVISDVVMPHMNGLELLAHIHSHHPSIHTIILSGYSDFPYVKSAFQQGIVDYILKPELNPETLVECLRKIRMQKNDTDKPLNSDLCSQLLAFINERYMEPLTLHDAAEQLHLNYSSISSRFSNIMGKGFKEVLNDVRIEKAKQLLTTTDWSILDIALEVGYADQSYFCKVFKLRTGDSPLVFRNAQRLVRNTHEELDC